MHLFISLLTSVTDLDGTRGQLKAPWVLDHCFSVPSPTQHPVPVATGLSQENSLSTRMRLSTRRPGLATGCPGPLGDLGSVEPTLSNFAAKVFTSYTYVEG